jgi:hypothetical protein
MSEKFGWQRPYNGAVRRTQHRIHAMADWRIRGKVLWTAFALVSLVGCATSQPTVDTSRPWADAHVTSKIVEPHSDPTQLCPADARLFIRADDLTTWRAEVGEDPILAQLWRATDGLRGGSGWEAAQKKLGLSQEQMQTTYLGRTFCLIEQKLNDRRGLIVMSRAESADLAKLQGALVLKQDEVIGPFRLFITESTKDKKSYLFAFGKRWFFLTEAIHRGHLRRLLSAVAHRDVVSDQGAPSLASTEGRPHRLLRKIPAEHSLLILTRNGSGTERHAAAIVRDGKKLVTHYAATIPSLQKMAGRFDYGRGVDFGPLPASTISAATINVMDREPEGIGTLNILIAPRSMERDVLPKIEAPMILFMGQVSSEQIKPNPFPGKKPVQIPVVGMALKLKDRSVKSDLDLLVMRTHMVANLVELDVIKTFFGMRIETEGQTKFTVGDFGQAIAKRINDPKMATLLKLPSSAGLTQLSFGRIGDWYVLCSQEAFFRQCVVAASQSEKRLTAVSDFNQFEFKKHPRQLAAIITRAPQLSTMLNSVESFWQDFAKEHEIDTTEKPKASTVPEPDTSLEPNAAEADKARAAAGRQRQRAPSPLKWVADGLEKRRSFAIQLWQDKDGDLIGRMHISAIEVEAPSATLLP